jgi:hypothetical protein
MTATIHLLSTSLRNRHIASRSHAGRQRRWRARASQRERARLHRRKHAVPVDVRTVLGIPSHQLHSIRLGPPPRGHAMSLLQIRPPAVQIRMMQMHVLFPVSHLHFSMLFVAAVTAVVVLFLVFECVWLAGLDQTPVAPQRGQFVAAQDDKHENHGHGEDRGRVEDIDEAFLVGEDGESSATGPEY